MEEKYLNVKMNSKINSDMIVAVDGSNIRAGGGLTHLTQLINHLDPASQGLSELVVFGGSGLLAKIPEKSWIKKVHEPILDRALPFRMIWQQLILPLAVKKMRCDILFSPGGTLPRFCSIPMITMSQNMLPFEPKEAARFGWSYMRLKMFLLTLSQSRSFRAAQGIIFLTQYAKSEVMRVCSGIKAVTALIPHGIEPRFRAMPKHQDPKLGQSSEFPFRLLYVSIIDVYKHQCEVAEAVARLRKKGISVTIDFVGGAYPPALAMLEMTLRDLDPRGEFLKYLGPVPFEQLHALYQSADGFVFASSCENLPNIMIEAMSAGLPIASSRKGPMPEVLGSNGVYFDPDDVASVEAALHELVSNPSLREKWARGAMEDSKQYSWERCAKETFDFISSF